jgi:hypothetical protein
MCVMWIHADLTADKLYAMHRSDVGRDMFSEWYLDQLEA